MKVLTSEFIEFGDLLIGKNEGRIALVREPYKVIEMTEKELDDYQGDWLCHDFSGEIYIVKPFNFRDAK
jgi:hypothetical protein